jgi:hypothetical protein
MLSEFPKVGKSGFEPNFVWIQNPVSCLHCNKIKLQYYSSPQEGTVYVSFALLPPFSWLKAAFSSGFVSRFYCALPL